MIKRNDSHFPIVQINLKDFIEETKHFGEWAVYLEGLHEQ